MNVRSQGRDKPGDGAPLPGGAIAAGRHVAELRHAFDASFATPPRHADQSGELVLAIQAGGQGYAIRLSDIDGVHECRKVVSLPGSPPGLLGITGIRGRLFAVHALGALLGLPMWNEKPRWLLIAGGAEPVALGVASIEACLEVSPADLLPALSTKDGEGHIREIVTLAGQTRGVLVLESLVAIAKQRAGERREGAQ
ncbi:chemotaxis protein CheW [Polyangium mundeleinium]|uniref:Chemotaxis protein CheW n=1 Tax=Polyangium mundeleinium TaxID=2995306 RepID=A0ABT5EES6_9BACT|nr:chemotaxis protein CheW [Polyangium mundeleinium]MDC0740315.1 chemotaxis protein CheW [Polyangium mundeleinium]